MADAGAPTPDDWGTPPRAVASPRFIFDEAQEDVAPRPGRWLRNWWWSGTRTERWAAALGAPVSLLLLLATCSVLNSDDLAQQTAASGTEAERPTAETTSASPTPTPTLTQVATVTTIVSGDTFVVLRDGELETVRLIGIDAPEMAGSAAGVQCWAVESLQFASDTLLQQDVRLVPDPTQGAVDGSGARLAYVLLADGRDFSVLSAGVGQARSYPETGPAPTAEPAPPPPPPPGAGRDPRFHNCQQANRAGYGPYRRGVDPEYWWYKDQDEDGVVCD